MKVSETEMEQKERKKVNENRRERVKERDAMAPRLERGYSKGEEGKDL